MVILNKKNDFFGKWGYIISLLISLIIIIILVYIFIRFENIKLVVYSFTVFSVSQIFITSLYCRIEGDERKGILNSIIIALNFICSVLNIIFNWIYYVPELYMFHILINTISIIILFINYQFVKDSIFQISKKYEYEINLKSLAPIDNIVDSYNVKALEEACHNEKNFNIALDGVYGSGKSSIIKSFLKNNKKYKTLNISFANFKDKNKSSDNKNSTLDTIMKTIYEEVLIHYVKNPNYFLSFIVLSLVCSIAFILNYHFKIVTIDVTLNIAFSITISLLFVLLTIVFSSIKRGKIGLGDYSLEIEISNNSIEMRKIQLINLLKKYNKDIIFVIEDLDRFDDINIYSSFRELNFVLNQRLPNRILFLYALDTSVFSNAEERVKFFDVIIPIVPVAAKDNISNELFMTIDDEIDPRLINVCSLCIDNMRLINSISNEYKVTKAHFVEKNEIYYKDSSNKIFAIVAFKNIFAKQYTELFKGLNFLDSIFNKIMNYNVTGSEKVLNFTDYINSEITKLPTSMNSIVNLNSIAYDNLIKIFSEVIVLYIPNEKKEFDFKVSNTYVQNETEKRELIEFLFQCISLGYINLDYVEYLSPVSFNDKKYQNILDYSSDLNIRKDMIFNISNHYEYEFKNAYFVCESLHPKCFSFNAILHYSIISLIFENAYFSNKKQIFTNVFLNKIDINNLEIKKLIFDFIDNYSSNPRSHFEFLVKLKSQLDFYKIFNIKDDLPYLAKYINIVTNNDIDTLIKITSFINQLTSLKKLIKENPVDFYELFDQSTLEYLLSNINSIIYNFTSSTLINSKMLKLNKFDKKLESLFEWFNEKNIKDNRIANLITSIRNEMNIDTSNQTLVIKTILNNISNSNEKFIEKMSVIKNIYDISRDINQTKKIAVNNLIIDEYYIGDTPYEVINHLIENKKIPFTLTFLEELHQSGITIEYKSKYVMQYISDIIKISDIVNYVSKGVFEHCIKTYKLESNVLKVIKDNYGLLPNNINIVSTENMLVYASEYDSMFTELPINSLFVCQNESLLSRFINKNDDKFYIEKIKSIYGRFPYVSGIDKFVNKCLPSYEIVNGILKEKVTKN